MYVRCLHRERRVRKYEHACLLVRYISRSENIKLINNAVIEVAKL